jgi:hypothetical protein
MGGYFYTEIYAAKLMASHGSEYEHQKYSSNQTNYVLVNTIYD